MSTPQGRNRDQQPRASALTRMFHGMAGGNGRGYQSDATAILA
jgi:hypothetical protein